MSETLSKDEYKRLIGFAGTDKKGRLKATKEDVEYIKTGTKKKKKKKVWGQKDDEVPSGLKGKHAVRASVKRKIAVEAGFRSYFEMRISEQLKRAGFKFKYENIKIHYVLKPNSVCTCKECGSKKIIEHHDYLPDFNLPNLHIEAKGLFTAKDRKKIIAVTKQHPKMVILMVFQENKTLSSKTETTYLDWAEKHNIKACMFNKMISSIVDINKSINK